MDSRHQKLLALLLIAMFCIVEVYFIANAIVSAMNGDYFRLGKYLDMAIGIVFCGIVSVWIVFNACKQDTGDPQPIPQMTPGPAGDCIV